MCLHIFGINIRQISLVLNKEFYLRYFFVNDTSCDNSVVFSSKLKLMFSENTKQKIKIM